MAFFQTVAGRVSVYSLLFGMFLLTMPIHAEKRIIVFVALAGKGAVAIRRSAADACAKNQRIGQKAALGVFSALQ